MDAWREMGIEHDGDDNEDTIIIIIIITTTASLVLLVVFYFIILTWNPLIQVVYSIMKWALFLSFYFEVFFIILAFFLFLSAFAFAVWFFCFCIWWFTVSIFDFLFPFIPDPCFVRFVENKSLACWSKLLSIWDFHEIKRFFASVWTPHYLHRPLCRHYEPYKSKLSSTL